MKTSAEAVQAPTKVRWIVLLIVMAIMAVTTLNRLNLSVAGKAIEDQFHFNTIAMGLIFSAFLWGYGLFRGVSLEVLGGPHGEALRAHFCIKRSRLQSQRIRCIHDKVYAVYL